MTIRLFIVDDHDLVREGLRLIFAGSGVEVVGEAVDGLEAFEKLTPQLADVLLVDIRMPRVDGFQFLQMRQSAGCVHPPVLMHSVQGGANVVRRCSQLGAKGLIRKGQDKEDLLEAVMKIHAGEEWWRD